MEVRERIIEALDVEIANLETAKKLLSGTTEAPKKPAGRVLSVEARERMSKAQKKRWRNARKVA